jgi:hypothetical protein
MFGEIRCGMDQFTFGTDRSAIMREDFNRRWLETSLSPDAYRREIAKQKIIKDSIRDAQVKLYEYMAYFLADQRPSDDEDVKAVRGMMICVALNYMAQKLVKYISGRV